MVGRRPSSSARSELRAAVLADRVEEKVATASSAVPPAVARLAAVPRSTLPVLFRFYFRFCLPSSTISPAGTNPRDPRAVNRPAGLRV